MLRRIANGFEAVVAVLFVVTVVLLVFGRGKIPELMGDMAKGIKSFKRGMADDTDADDPKTVEHRSDEPIKSSREKVSKG